ncbi:MAG: hypothetical protein QOD77_307 [Thermoplasmata archaeon]|jgi:hypothetical protein|nr:hypothetical protein [Thermoplasmata archaeon]
MRRATLAAVALLAFLAVPAAFALSDQADTPDCVVLVVNTIGVVCKGTYWCDSGGICAQEYCTLTIGPKEYACILSPP